MDEELGKLIKEYGYWAFHAGLQFGMNNIQRYKLFTKKEDAELGKIKHYLSTQPSQTAKGKDES